LLLVGDIPKSSLLSALTCNLLFLSSSPSTTRTPTIHPHLFTMMRFAASLLSFVGLAMAATIPLDGQRSLERRSGPTCTTFKVPITASAQNTVINLPPNYDANSNPLGQLTNSIEGSGETILGNVLGDLILTSGTYNINMQYCVPEVYNASRADTLQCEW
jgi:hypothetical protein